MFQDLKEASFYKKLDNNKVKCYLCPHNCLINDKHRGICKVRENRKGILYTLNYGKIASASIDPIEKKPLFHFYPGKNILSIGSFGCNLKCSFCQNYRIAQEIPSYKEVDEDSLVDLAIDRESNIGIAYTYNEPSIWYEYVLETAKKAKMVGLNNVLVTNGYINDEPLRELLPFIDAMNIDLKAFNNKFYNEICIGEVNKVLQTIKMANDHCLVEISTLLIEGLNTKREEINELASWISSVNKDIPLHLNRYYPAYKMTLPPTSIEKIDELISVAKQHLNYVYKGNVLGADRNTYCPKCRALIISRNGEVRIENLDKNKCTICGQEIDIVL